MRANINQKRYCVSSRKPQLASKEITRKAMHM